MRGDQRKRRQDKELGPVLLRTWRHWGSTVYQQCKLDPVTYFHFHDRFSYGGYNYITIKELAHSFTLASLSAGGCGIGIGLLISRILGG